MRAAAKQAARCTQLSGGIQVRVFISRSASRISRGVLSSANLERSIYGRFVTRKTTTRTFKCFSIWSGCKCPWVSRDEPGIGTAYDNSRRDTADLIFSMPREYRMRAAVSVQCSL